MHTYLGSNAVFRYKIFLLGASEGVAPLVRIWHLLISWKLLES